MENENKNTEEKTTSIKKHESSHQGSLLSLNRISELEKIVESFKDSTLASQFIENQYPKDEDGNTNTDAKPIKVFNKADMVLCLALGEELGIPPVVALSYGKALNLKAVKKIEKGKKLGLDYATALEQVYVWGEGTKEIIYTSIHIVNMALTKAGVSKEIIQNGTIGKSLCKEIETGLVVDFNPSIHKDIIISNLPKDQQEAVLSALKDNGLVGVNKLQQLVYTAEVKLTRYNRSLQKEESVSIPYSSQQAIDAGLLKGIKTDGTESKGKDNWNAHPATHLIKMSIMIGGRMIASDVLNGVYEHTELSFVDDKVKVDAEDVFYEEVSEK